MCRFYAVMDMPAPRCAAPRPITVYTKIYGRVLSISWVQLDLSQGGKFTMGVDPIYG